MRWCFLALVLASSPLSPAAAQTGDPAAGHPPPPAAETIAKVGQPGWTVDAANGCWVWNPNPQRDETVHWSGPCADGPAQGEGVLIWRYTREGQSGEERYVGTVARGQLHGIGTYLDSSGEIYQGEFQDGREQGRGLRVFATGRYDGEWRRGQRHGRGVIFWINGNLFRGEFQNGLPEGPGEFYSVEDGWFRGDWQAGCLRDGDRVAALGKPIEVCRTAMEG